MDKDLPYGWSAAVLGDVATVQSGVGFPKKYQGNPDGTLPVYKVGDVSKAAQFDDGYLRTSSNFVSETDAQEMRGKIYPVGATLFAKIGEALRLNRRGYVELPGLADNNVMGVKAHCSEQDRFLYHFLRTQDLAAFSRSTTVPSIRKGDVENIELKLPPLAEQTRIANKLDELLAQVDTIKARVDAIPGILKRFRQSVLAAAVSGRLTEEWREKNPDEAADIEEIQSCWAADWRRDGRKFKPPKIQALDESPEELPAVWLHTQIGYVFDVYVGATPSRKKSEYWNGGVPWVSSSEVAFCRIADTKEKITEAGLGNTSTSIHPAGTVMLAMIGQGKTRGQPAILDICACHNQNTAALRVPEDYCSSEFLYYYLWERYEQTRKVGGGNNQKALNKASVQGLAFPLPPLDEQLEIVKIVDALFAFADQIERQVQNATDRVGGITQSILAKAFRGELVPQDPGDEPASVLLERINGSATS